MEMHLLFEFRYLRMIFLTYFGHLKLSAQVTALFPLQVKNGSTYEGHFETLCGEDDKNMDLTLSFARLFRDEEGKPCPPTAERHKMMIFKSRDWVKVEALDVPNNFDGRDNHTANGGLATDSDISKGRGG
jgi:Ataxin 2 SM domain